MKEQNVKRIKYVGKEVVVEDVAKKIENLDSYGGLAIIVKILSFYIYNYVQKL